MHFICMTIIQTMFMMLGESLCMVAYLVLKYIVYKDDPKKVDGDALEMNPLVLWPVRFKFSKNNK